MATREFAKRVGLMKTIFVKDHIPKQQVQQFDYLFVLDFESTCWNSQDSQKRQPEIIEFSVVCYDVKEGKIIEEFQQYVMSMESSKLSNFCTSLTGIKQEQVDQGVPLGTCLMIFMKWLQSLQKNYKFTFSNKGPKRKNCIFATWTDWDLQICLPNECKRKRIMKPDLFSSWIDIKALYKDHYNRKPEGLKGALNEVGLNFVGREHCGLDDARNTAYLITRMIEDCCTIKAK